ncbi:hypothetical protein CBI33_26855 [Rhodococcus erythropolis]|nr:hypothetical protein CBI33_26855 [Rhodococcus erythropolis]
MTFRWCPDPSVAPDNFFFRSDMELRIGGMRARRNAWAAKFFSEASLKKFSEPEAGEAARGCAGTPSIRIGRTERKRIFRFYRAERSGASSWGTPEVAGPPGRRMQ